MNRIEIETLDLNEQALSDWVQKGRLRDRVRARRWRIIRGILIALFAIACALYASLARN